VCLNSALLFDIILSDDTRRQPIIQLAHLTRTAALGTGIRITSGTSRGRRANHYREIVGLVNSTTPGAGLLLAAGLAAVMLSGRRRYWKGRYPECGSKINVRKYDKIKPQIGALHFSEEEL
jgi:hypothetical protein